MDLKPKILIVDDRPENLVALRTVLRDLDIELVEATSGNEALKATLYHNFALALLDIQMPEMDGYELAGILREEEKTSDMPFIFISAVYTDNLNVFKGYERGAFSFITKPFQPEILINKVRFFIEKHHQEITLHQLYNDLQKKTDELESKAGELAQSSKYKSEFMANMSHELRTPLNSILLLSKFLADNPDKNLTPDQVEFASVIHNSGSSLLHLINEILDLSKIEAGKMEIDLQEISLQTICKNISDLFMPLAREKKINFSVTISDDLPGVIETDKQRLEQVLKNFLSNALKFTEEGSVELIVYKPNKSPGEFGSEKTGKFIAFEVKDSGIGIPEEKHALIFDAFQQADGSTRRKYGGTGLGLSISREIVRMLGGEIILTSEVGKGSSFTVLLPVGL
jgi:signal transduction histidine kinase